MSPKEKAEELLNKYKTFIVMWSGGVEVENENVRQCAMIVVKEVIKTLLNTGSKYNQEYENAINKDILFWEQVQTELIKERQHESSTI